MKKILVLFLLLSASLAYPSATNAQVNVHVNIGSQPLWGPTGYDYAEYYYMPEIDVFYDIPRRQYVYFDGGRWIFSFDLPGRYSHYDLYRGYKVVINEPSPWLRWNAYHDRYYSYRDWHNRQVIIRDSRDPRYYVVPGHPYYGNGKYNDISRRDYDRWNNNRRDYDRRYDDHFDNHGHDKRYRDYDDHDNNRGRDKGWKDSNRNDDHNRGRGRKG